MANTFQFGFDRAKIGREMAYAISRKRTAIDYRSPLSDWGAHVTILHYHEAGTTALSRFYAFNVGVYTTVTTYRDYNEGSNTLGCPHFHMEEYPHNEEVRLKIKSIMEEDVAESQKFIRIVRIMITQAWRNWNKCSELRVSVRNLKTGEYAMMVFDGIGEPWFDEIEEEVRL